ncbi:hypothetical protein [Pseudomonas sp. ML96]|uniref:hypothetical protein n=1 Tax=Pseudomonas sp. ML96 TaxID=1523503 RepID=UPI0005BE7C0C|nr:hypothetical protein [Pseudomonas sp. ML96]
MRQPDIEIYLKDADQQSIAAWLNEAIGPCSEWQQSGQIFKCQAGSIPVVFLPKAVGKWHSLMLESDATPWEDDVSCAHAAFAALGVEIRCSTGGWSEEEGEEDADRWIKVNAEGAQEFIWRTD